MSEGFEVGDWVKFEYPDGRSFTGVVEACWAHRSGQRQVGQQWFPRKLACGDGGSQA